MLEVTGKASQYVQNCFSPPDCRVSRPKHILPSYLKRRAGANSATKSKRPVLDFTNLSLPALEPSLEPGEIDCPAGIGRQPKQWIWLAQ